MFPLIISDKRKSLKNQGILQHLLFSVHIKLCITFDTHCLNNIPPAEQSLHNGCHQNRNGYFVVPVGGRGLEAFCHG